MSFFLPGSGSNLKHVAFVRCHSLLQSKIVSHIFVSPISLTAFHYVEWPSTWVQLMFPHDQTQCKSAFLHSWHTYKKKERKKEKEGTTALSAMRTRGAVAMRGRRLPEGLPATWGPVTSEGQSTLIDCWLWASKIWENTSHRSVRAHTHTCTHICVHIFTFSHCTCTLTHSCTHTHSRSCSHTFSHTHIHTL